MENEKEFQNETFVCFVEYKGYKVEVWNDDYGQSYFFKFRDKKGDLCEASCGSYNTDYETEIHDFIDHCLYDGTLKENITKRYESFKETNILLSKIYETILEEIKDIEDEKEIKRIIDRITFELSNWDF